MTEKQTGTFEPLPLKHRTFVPLGANQYRVFSPAGESKQIEAATAYEALKLSGLGQAIKIERISNITKIIFEKKDINEDSVSEKTAEPQAGNDILKDIREQQKCVVSPDEMDAMKQALQEIAARHAAAIKAASMPVPPPHAEALPEPAVAPGAGGMDVHGDGFDEIIPSAPAAKPAAAKPADAKEAVKSEPEAAPTTPQPDRELSKEEVDKLLGGAE